MSVRILTLPITGDDSLSVSAEIGVQIRRPCLKGRKMIPCFADLSQYMLPDRRVLKSRYMFEPMTSLTVRYDVQQGKRTSDRLSFAVIKRIVDVALGSIAVLAAIPVLAICSAVIKLSSRGPVVYSQIRVGKGGRLFKMYKLRTMYHDIEASTGPVWAKDNDPRVIPVCRWMRRSHLDELPQLINVLRGEMSLVGPRPERPEIMAELEKTFPHINGRLIVQPGITGLAQIRNGYDKTIDGVHRKLEADMEYIATRKVSVELMILAATLPKFYDKSAC